MSSRLSPAVVLDPDRGLGIRDVTARPAGPGAAVGRGETGIAKPGRLYLSGRLPLDELVTRTRPLGEAAQAFDDLGSNSGSRTDLHP